MGIDNSEISPGEGFFSGTSNWRGSTSRSPISPGPISVAPGFRIPRSGDPISRGRISPVFDGAGFGCPTRSFSVPVSVELDLSYARMSGARLHNLCLDRVDLTGVTLDGVAMENVHFQDVTLYGVTVTGIPDRRGTDSRGHEILIWPTREGSMVVIGCRHFHSLDAARDHFSDEHYPSPARRDWFLQRLALRGPQ